MGSMTTGALEASEGARDRGREREGEKDGEKEGGRERRGLADV